MPLTPDNLQTNPNELIKASDDAQESSSEEIGGILIKRPRNNNNRKKENINKARKTNNTTVALSLEATSSVSKNIDNMRATFPVGPNESVLPNYGFDNLATQQLVERLGFSFQHFTTRDFLFKYAAQSSNKVSTMSFLKYLGAALRSYLPPMLSQHYTECRLLRDLDENSTNIFKITNLNPDKFLPLMLPAYFNYTKDEHRSVFLCNKQMPDLSKVIDYDTTIKLLNYLLDIDLKELKEQLNVLTKDYVSPAHASSPPTKFNYPRRFVDTSPTQVENSLQQAPPVVDDKEQLDIGVIFKRIAQQFPIIIKNHVNLSKQNLQLFIDKIQDLAALSCRMIHQVSIGTSVQTPLVVDLNAQLKVAIEIFTQTVRRFPIIIENSIKLSTPDLQLLIAEVQNLANLSNQLMEQLNVDKPSIFSFK